MNILLRCNLCPGDILMLTAAVRELKQHYPYFQIDIDTPYPELWYNNPYITKLSWSKDLATDEIKTTTDLTIINCSYTEAINKSKRPYHFIHGYCQDLENKLNIKIRMKKASGSIYLSKEEKESDFLKEKVGWEKPYWVFNAGAKSDIETKRYNPAFSQEIINHFKDKIQFVQIGNIFDWHLPLKNTINLIGKTSIRDLVKLVYNAQGILCPVTFLMHLSKATPLNKNKYTFDIRPTVVIAGGREPSIWERYEGHKFLDTVGTMDCCSNGGCWKSKLVQEKETDKICKYPIEVKNELYIAKCMMNITPNKIIDAIESYFENGLISYIN